MLYEHLEHRFSKAQTRTKKLNQFHLEALAKY